MRVRACTDSFQSPSAYRTSCTRAIGSTACSDQMPLSCVDKRGLHRSGTINRQSWSEMCRTGLISSHYCTILSSVTIRQDCSTSLRGVREYPKVSRSTNSSLSIGIISARERQSRPSTSFWIVVINSNATMQLSDCCAERQTRESWRIERRGNSGSQVRRREEIGRRRRSCTQRLRSERRPRWAKADGRDCYESVSLNARPPWSIQIPGFPGSRGSERGRRPSSSSSDNDERRSRRRSDQASG